MKLIVLGLLLSIAAFAADVTGTWKGSAETPNGTIERTFVFKVDGNKLTGETTSNMMGKSVIENGKVDGDNLSFSIMIKIQDDEVKIDYKGKVDGKQIKLTAETPNGAIEYIVKKVE